MKTLLSTIGIALLVTTAVAAQEATPPTVKAENVVEDCTKQVWPDFSPACLRNTDKAICHLFPLENASWLIARATTFTKMNTCSGVSVK